jgi:hypothetical protein
MKNLVLAAMLLVAFIGMANDGWPNRSSTKTYKFEVKKGFDYKKHQKKHKKAWKHSRCRKVDFIH